MTSPYVQVPIKLNLTNELPDGYSLASVDTNVDEVTVYGPKEVIDAMKSETYPGPEIDLSDVTSDRVIERKMPVLENIVKVEPDYLKVALKVVPSKPNAWRRFQSASAVWPKTWRRAYCPERGKRCPRWTSTRLERRPYWRN